ncbi:hypothetical protein N7468_006257 [Penicillium chermesinum]|uniref:Uncharacterized protein n=1 Tax=Penicillium chermesinum TaxID=63820 RepID=A0A9W9TJE3_9EURO|nr:uncharacterized protein N7468_006257 [Penicillium chermesinum]KAJ5225032.1 hypothetical protein N7468_006257 [Penicillium chermesinum]KAJ6151761.1 hypothetical protein N7470_006889 [Penicillium chermesinum]
MPKKAGPKNKSGYVSYDHPLRDFHHCPALTDQINTLGTHSTPTDVASVWASILSLWFPVREGYQIRQIIVDAWIEVYAIRVALRRREEEVSFNPVMAIRCQGGLPDRPEPVSWTDMMKDMAITIKAVCNSVHVTNARHRPAWAGMACGHIVFFAKVNTVTFSVTRTEAYPYTLSIQHSKDDIQEFLDGVKEGFLKKWGPLAGYSIECDVEEGSVQPADSAELVRESVESKKEDCLVGPNGRWTLKLTK